MFHFWCLYFIFIFYTVSNGLLDETFCPLRVLFLSEMVEKAMKLLILAFFVLFFLSPFWPSHKLTQEGQMKQDNKIHGEYPYELFISLSFDNIYKSLGFEAQLFSSHNTDIMWSLLICIEGCTWRYWHRLQYSILCIY